MKNLDNKIRLWSIALSIVFVVLFVLVTFIGTSSVLLAITIVLAGLLAGAISLVAGCFQYAKYVLNR